MAIPKGHLQNCFLIFQLVEFFIFFSTFKNKISIKTHYYLIPIYKNKGSLLAIKLYNFYVCTASLAVEIWPIVFHMVYSPYTIHFFRLYIINGYS